MFLTRLCISKNFIRKESNVRTISKNDGYLKSVNNMNKKLKELNKLENSKFLKLDATNFALAMDEAEKKKSHYYS